MVGARIACVTPRFGPAAIESDEDAAKAAPRVRGYVSRNSTSADAIVIACFSDPGLESARKSTPIPVFGMAGSGYPTALTRGESFGVISILESAIPRHRR